MLQRDRLFLKDAGIEFTEVRYPYDDTWPQASKKLQEQGISRSGLVPALEYKGKILTQVRIPLYSMSPFLLHDDLI